MAAWTAARRDARRALTRGGSQEVYRLLFVTTCLCLAGYWRVIRVFGRYLGLVCWHVLKASRGREEKVTVFRVLLNYLILSCRFDWFLTLFAVMLIKR